MRVWIPFDVLYIIEISGYTYTAWIKYFMRCFLYLRFLELSKVKQTWGNHIFLIKYPHVFSNKYKHEANNAFFF